MTLGVYKEISEASPATLSILSTPTPSWLDLDYPDAPPPGPQKTMRELVYLRSLVPLRMKHGAFVKAADEDLIGLFVRLCVRLGVPCDRSELERISAESVVPIIKLKWHYNRPRPYQVAERTGVAFYPMASRTADTPAYPSGHTIQAFLLAACLSRKYPQHRRAFMRLADSISKSRMVGGYHWPSDLEFGRVIAARMARL